MCYTKIIIEMLGKRRETYGSTQKEKERNSAGRSLTIDLSWGQKCAAVYRYAENYGLCLSSEKFCNTDVLGMGAYAGGFPC